MNINTKIQEFLKHLASNGHKERLQLVLTIIKSQFTDGFLSQQVFLIFWFREVIDFFEQNGEKNLLNDPFMGSGTTGAVGRELGVNVISAEINPLLYKICEIKLQTCATKDSKSFHLATEKL